MKFNARIIINDSITDGQFTKSFLIKLAKMGAEIMVSYNGETIDMCTNYGFNYIQLYAIKKKEI